MPVFIVRVPWRLTLEPRLGLDDHLVEIPSVDKDPHGGASRLPVFDRPLFARRDGVKVLKIERIECSFHHRSPLYPSPAGP